MSYYVFALASNCTWYITLVLDGKLLMKAILLRLFIYTLFRIIYCYNNKNLITRITFLQSAPFS